MAARFTRIYTAANMTLRTDAEWLLEFAAAAEKTDSFQGKPDHPALLAAGLIGEAGSIVSELKKSHRERDAYPVYRGRMLEEVGDFIWYFTRLATVVTPGLISELSGPEQFVRSAAGASQLMQHLDFAASVGQVLAAISASEHQKMRALLREVWAQLTLLCNDANISLTGAAEQNKRKTRSRWPDEKRYAPLFDDDFPVEEQLPRRLRVDFLERSRGPQRAVILRCNDINFGDRLTDNIEDPDGYRFHDIFHFAYAVHLGWSPVVRALMRTKRKSTSRVDEAQDGARAGILEEAVSAITFSRAKQLEYFRGLDHVDLDLLKTVTEFVEGFEVETVPLWQWETAILDGYRVFRSLYEASGGRVTLDLCAHKLDFAPHTPSEDQQRLQSSSAG